MNSSFYKRTSDDNDEELQLQDQASEEAFGMCLSWATSNCLFIRMNKGAALVTHPSLNKAIPRDDLLLPPTMKVKENKQQVRNK